jgi:hypothetical protein
VCTYTHTCVHAVCMCLCVCTVCVWVWVWVCTCEKNKTKNKLGTLYALFVRISSCTTLDAACRHVTEGNLLASFLAISWIMSVALLLDSDSVMLNAHR